MITAVYVLGLMGEIFAVKFYRCPFRLLSPDTVVPAADGDATFIVYVTGRTDSRGFCSKNT
jgi:hypothetical protein